MISKRIFNTIMILLLCFSMGARADNLVTVNTVSGEPGTEVTVNVGLENSDDVSSLQVSIPLGTQLTLVEGSAALSDRCGSHALTVGVKDGSLNLFIYSLSMAAISGNSGEVASFRLKLGSNPVAFTLEALKVKLIGSSGSELTSSASNGQVTVLGAKAQFSSTEVDFGTIPIRSTYTRTMNVSNVGTTDLTVTGLNFSDMSVFSSTTQLPLVVAPGGSASVNITYEPVERGATERTLTVVSNSVPVKNTIKLKANPYAVNILSLQPVAGNANEEVTISMTMQNMDDVSGFQVEFDLPDELAYVDGSFVLSSRKGDHTYLASLTGNKLRLLAYSPSDMPFSGHEGEIATFRLLIQGRYDVSLTPSKTVLSATINNKVENVLSQVNGTTISVQSPQISAVSTLSFGEVSLKSVCEKPLYIYNYGGVPLTVSRIVCNGENLSVSESAPMVIPSWGQRSVLVTYSGMEEAAFEGTIQIYSDDPKQRLLEVRVTGSRFAPNYMSLRTPDIFRTQDLGVVVALDNYDTVKGLQFDLTYPSQYYEPYENGYALEARAAGMSVTYRQIDENTTRYFCYFLSENGIAPGTGDVMTVRLHPTAAADFDEPVEPPVIPVDITSSYITNPNPVSNINGWTAPKGKPNAFDSRNNCAEFWNLSGYSIQQTLHNLPAGNYRLEAVAFTRAGYVSTLSAGNASVNLVTVSSTQVNNLTQANAWFNQGNGVNVLDFTQETDGDVTIALTADATAGDHWTVWRSFRLYRVEPFGMSLYNDEVSVTGIKLGTEQLNNKYKGGNLSSSFKVLNAILGDVNSDGDVDIADAVCIVNHVVGKATPAFNEQAADVNADGDIDIADAVRIVNLVVGKIDALSRRLHEQNDMREPE